MTNWALSHLVPIVLQFELGLQGQAETRESHFYHTGNDGLAVCVSPSPQQIRILQTIYYPLGNWQP